MFIPFINKSGEHAFDYNPFMIDLYAYSDLIVKKNSLSLSSDMRLRQEYFLFI